MTPSVVKFVPIASGSEPGEARPVLELQSSPNVQQSDQLHLGRNGKTKISAPRMSRKIAKVHWIMTATTPELYIQSTGGYGFVHINAKPLLSLQSCHLPNGDIVSLQCPEKLSSYDYRVEIKLGTTTAQINTATPAPTVTKRQKLDPTEEFICAICLEIMVEPVNVIPCGHSFCSSCLTDSVSECHTCRSVLTQRPIPARSLNHAIALLVEYNPGLFATDDVEHYRLRTAGTNLAGSANRRKSPTRASKRVKHATIGTAIGVSADNAIEID